MEDLREVHEESIKPKSIEEQAHSVDLTLSKKEIAENNTRPVLVQVLKINGIDHESLNMSKSKFNKLNKGELVDILFSKPQEQAKQETKETADSTADYLQKVLELKAIIEEAKETKDYKKLDSAVASQLLEAVGNDDSIANIDYKSPHFTRIIIALGVVYFVARIYGFERIGVKFKEMLDKIKGVRSEEAKSN